MEQEKELLHGKISWLKDELKAKTEGLLSLSRKKGNEILELKCKLENKEDEVKISLFHFMSFCCDSICVVILISSLLSSLTMLFLICS